MIVLVRKCTPPNGSSACSAWNMCQQTSPKGWFWKCDKTS